jgi:hypothetical protein
MFYLSREHEGEWLDHRYGLDHKLFNFLSIAVTKEGLHKVPAQDYMHLIWRLRVLLLKQNLMHLGPGQLVSAEHLKDCPFLKTGDLDYHDKQNWGACQRIFSLQVFEYLIKKVDGFRWEGSPKDGQYVEDWYEDGGGKSRNYEPQMAGTACYIYFGYSLMTCWLQDGDLAPEHIIEHAAFCMSFVLYWRYWLKYQMDNPLPGSLVSYNIRHNFLTRETFLDVVISAAARVLVYILYKTHPKLRKWKPCGNRMSSRFNEYLFQFIRMRNTNTPAMRALAALRHFKHYAAQMAIAGEADFDLPDYRRTVSASIKKGGVVEQRALPGYYELNVTPEKIDAAIDRGMHRCQKCSVTNVASSSC